MKTKLASLTLITALTLAAILASTSTRAASSSTPAPANNPAEAAKFALDYPEANWGPETAKATENNPITAAQLKQIILYALKKAKVEIENTNDSLVIGSYKRGGVKYPIYIKYDARGTAEIHANAGKYSSSLTKDILMGLVGGFGAFDALAPKAAPINVLAKKDNDSVATTAAAARLRPPQMGALIKEGSNVAGKDANDPQARDTRAFVPDATTSAAISSGWEKDAFTAVFFISGTGDVFTRGEWKLSVKPPFPHQISGLDDSYVQTALGMLLMRMEPELGVSWLLKAAAQGEQDAIMSLGISYANNPQVKNTAEAERWFRKAVELGNTDAGKKLGDLLAGKPVDSSFTTLHSYSFSFALNKREAPTPPPPVKRASQQAPAAQPKVLGRFALDYPIEKWGPKICSVTVDGAPTPTMEQIKQAVIAALKAHGWTIEGSTDSLVVGSIMRGNAKYPAYVKFDGKQIDIYVNASGSSRRWAENIQKTLANKFSQNQ